MGSGRAVHARIGSSRGPLHTFVLLPGPARVRVRAGGGSAAGEQLQPAGSPGILRLLSARHQQGAQEQGSDDHGAAHDAG